MGFYSRSKRINLALQGGGAHGAFTWGVLDRLLEESGIEIGWISGTSAGAVNAVAMAAGLAVGGGGGARGRAEARATLQRVWDAVEVGAAPDIAKLNPFFYGLTKASGLSQMGHFSPYDFNPLGFDPLRTLLETRIDFVKLRADAASGIELLIAATDVSTGRPRLFRRRELTVEAVLASACLPTLHHAVEIDGRAYWDGGYSANPDVLTLAAESPVEDTLIVQLNPLERQAAPRTARDIAGQVNTITFNQPLLKDIETIVAAQRELRSSRRWLWRKLGGRRGMLDRIAHHRFHLIEAGRHTSSLSYESKAAPERAVLQQLHRAGRTEASRWLERYRVDIGRRQTVDLAARYLERDRGRLAASPALPPGAEEADPVAPAGSRI